MPIHHFEAVFTKVTVRCEFGEDFVGTRRQVTLGARFAARGNGTAASIASEIAPIDHEWEIYRVVDGVRSSVSIREEERARARQFGRQRFFR